MDSSQRSGAEEAVKMFEDICSQNSGQPFSWRLRPKNESFQARVANDACAIVFDGIQSIGNMMGW